MYSMITVSLMTTGNRQATSTGRAHEHPLWGEVHRQGLLVYDYTAAHHVDEFRPNSRDPLPPMRIS